MCKKDIAVKEETQACRDSNSDLWDTVAAL